MRYLILAKHAAPAIQRDVPASQWQLSAAGRVGAERLADALAAYDPALIVTSTEPKARETGEIVASRLDRPVEVADGLHEHARREAGWLGPAEFQRAVAALFAAPDRLVFGEETASQARERFARAVHDVLERHAAGNLVIVAHGTVISLFVASRAGGDPFLLWQRLGLPSYVALACAR